MSSSIVPWISAVLLLLVMMSETRHIDGEEHRTIMCDKLEDGLKDGFLVCFELASNKYGNLQKAITDCAKEALPLSDGNMKILMEEGCKNKQILRDFSSCCGIFYRDQANAEEINNSKNDPDIKKCFGALEEKFGIPMWYH